MGKAMSVITSPFKYYNIESRAHKVISQSKPVVAPKFKDTIKDLERVIKGKIIKLISDLTKIKTFDDLQIIQK